ncbi:MULTISPECIES: MurR/RpiR family transcriptional regulator [unclassified Bacillus (in: firmicutes)]|uniref:MurR/RpiR family transcriptional regulator n=1 Tax=unclassified Bacillus (in: firmicutes) TaxID=185979 RepID=UPI0008EF7AE4|nr:MULTISPECIES: MurR/RpiR family transcriptional regulator [unclassified Bacillus (in: firmicutes)]SFB24123.1 DNA-binding transcriptional regulator, MurR/RpiR family, contains HTH and SIS domains [Bacillus sp. UNCCL13]SFQ91334.1 DNA-binding transcriptional regulator, MurR/RpiR family, contains HTH and SIS domains [Bacillus sp. cl95]
MVDNCLGRIRSYYARLSEKEKRIADYILAHPEKIIHCTISEISEDLGIADATVFRFSKRIGYKGYQAFKIALASEMVSPSQAIYEEIHDEDDEKSITQKVFQSNIRTLENTLNMLDRQMLKQAVHMLLNAKRIEFYGTGGSAVIALDAYHKFIRSGIQAYAFPDSHFQLMAASQLTYSDVAVIISHTGKNKDTLAILQAAKENGAKTIGITSFPKSPLGQNVDVALFSSSEETEYRPEALASRIGQLSIIDALYVNVMALNKDHASTSFGKVSRAISQTRL